MTRKSRVNEGLPPEMAPLVERVSAKANNSYYLLASLHIFNPPPKTLPSQ